MEILQFIYEEVVKTHEPRVSHDNYIVLVV